MPPLTEVYSPTRPSRAPWSHTGLTAATVPTPYTPVNSSRIISAADLRQGRAGPIGNRQQQTTESVRIMSDADLRQGKSQSTGSSRSKI